MDKKDTLLSIAIPTYNRASILKKSLGKLLPQIIANAENIELIISDNASTDNTQDILNEYKKLYTQINFKIYLQLSNTGYYGNFKRCRELSNGKYFWLLSDNEQIEDGVVSFLIENIKTKNQEVGVYYFDNIEYNKSNKKKYHIYDTKFKYLIQKQIAHKLTLISAVVMQNIKDSDTYVNNNYYGNSFLGFLFLINSVSHNDNISIISGKSYISLPCNVYFDIFNSWTKDILECVEYMIEIGVLNHSLRINFVTGYLKNIIKRHVTLYCLYGELDGRTYGTKKEVRSILDNNYIKYDYYLKSIRPLFSYNKLNLQKINYHRRISYKINEILYRYRKFPK